MHPRRLLRALVPADVRPTRLRRVSLLTTVGLWLVVTTGATVRLTASGLGCANWPRCGSTPFPTEAKGGHAVIEFSNRAVALVAVLLTLLAWLNARRTPGLPRWADRLSLVLFVVTFAQIPLGGILTLAHLNPYLVMWHFFLALVALGCAVVLTFEAWGLERGRARNMVPRRVRELGLVLVAACAALVVTGAFATASGPHPGSLIGIRRIYTVEGTVYVHVRATAVFGIALVIVLAVIALRARPLLPFGGALLVLLGCQMAVGEIQYHDGLPWWLVLVHVALASAVWAVTVALVTALWRPPAALAAHIDWRDGQRASDLAPADAGAAGARRSLSRVE
jgi:cytochrome c oxidase assembly protein subunit 15